jgi:sugar lactone lactonase YvrE
MAVTPDDSTLIVSESFAGALTAFDIGPGHGPVRPGRVPCTLGGEDGRTLFMLAADRRMQGGFEDNIERLTTGPETGQVLTARASAATPATPERPARSSPPGRPRGQPGKAECEPRITGGLVCRLRGSSRGRGDR